EVTLSSGAMSFLFVTLWSPVQLGVAHMDLGWAIEALVLLAVALVTKDVRIRVAGWGVLLMATFTQLASISEAPATALAHDYGRVVVLIVIAAVYLGAYVEHTCRSNQTRDLAVVMANVLTISWLSLEVYGALATDLVAPRPQDLQFALSGVWAAYAGILFLVGVFLRLRPARIMSLCLFGITIAKMAINDLWLLDTLQRLVGFFGIGVLLLASSLLYHRSREWGANDDVPGVTP
ncbi:MAG: hypothetical protein QOH90_788, partial [Actinomycetota bacterium]|nr:hypothetical protein [Actinomycetota bacterium]